MTALDLPRIADGLQRDGPQVREPVDTRLRRQLIAGGLRWSVVAGSGDAGSGYARVEAAVDAVAPLLRQRSAALGSRHRPVQPLGATRRQSTGVALDLRQL